MSSRTIAVAVCLLASLVGCPDAVRGTAPREADGGSGDGGVETQRDAAALATAPVRLAEASGPLALGPEVVFVATGKGIVAVPKRGGTAVTVVADTLSRPIAADDTHLFYQEESGYSNLEAVSHAGTNPRRVATNVDVKALAVDQGRLFFGTNNSAVRAVDLDADGAVEATLRARNPDAPAILLALTPHYVVLLISDVYHEQRIVRRPRGSLEAAADEVVVKVSHVLALRTAGGVAYWLAEGAGIGAADIEGTSTSARVVGDAVAFDGGALAVDADHVFWTSRTEGRLYRAPRATGVPEIIATGFTFADETLGQYEQLRTGSQGRLAVDGAAVYVSDETGVFRVPKP